VLRDEEKTEEVIFYIIANPVRKGLVQNPLDCPTYTPPCIYNGPYGMGTP